MRTSDAKFIQIAAAFDGGHEATLFALDASGGVWILLGRWPNAEWSRVPEKRNNARPDEKADA